MFTKSFVFGALVLAATVSQAQTSILAVTGTIGVPACTLTITGNGIASFGALTAHDIQTSPTFDSYSASRYLYAPTKTMTLSVLCPTAAKVALSFVDNKASSAKPSAVTSPIRFGLGTYTPPGGTAVNIGSYYIHAPTINVKATAAAVAAPSTFRFLTAGVATTTSTWHKGVLVDETDYIVPGSSTGFGATATAITPDSLVSIVGDINIRLEPLTETINSATTAITLDGSATVTLVTL